MTTNPPQQSGPAGADPSMEDILASIRRILSEDDGDKPPPALNSGAPQATEEPRHVAPEVFSLDASMLVDDPQPAAVLQRAEPPPAVTLAPALPPAPAPAAPADPPLRPASSGLIGDAAASAAASSVGSLLRTLASERQQVAVYRGGPTLEDLVREEMRPILKQWLDANLPPMVERLVRAEIERVVGRALS